MLRAESAENARLPKEAILFHPNFKILIFPFCFVRKLLTIRLMLSKQHFPCCRSFHFVSRMNNHCSTVQNKVTMPQLLIFMQHDESRQAVIAALREKDHEDEPGTITLARCLKNSEKLRK
jgi:hypothetical protein